ncbi:hypothetical protein [Paraburkholderia sediminicola]|uniref:hypothetical protein n=1 Tax=Paraburkholderia sediminicola TaxID=458836 RepID=UPI0038BC8A0C
MRKIFSIPVQKLFIVTLLLKVTSSGIGWVINDPWLFGFAFPLTVMAVYILIGGKRLDKSVSDEKFADSCYYLGFIFTVTSIIFCLLDLPSIGTKMSFIAVRFGAAMVSTVFGLMVRVYWVSFREDFDDAVKSAEGGVIDASHRLCEQLTMVLENLRDLQTQVDDATNQSVAKVSVGIEELTKFYGQKLSEFFQQLTAENAKAFSSSLNEVKEASRRLSNSVDSYSNGMTQNLQSVESRVMQFADVVTRRLEQTTFPDDYFASRLTEPLAQLSQDTNDIATTVRAAAGEMLQSVDSLRIAAAAMRSRSSDVDGMLERVIQLAASQDALLAGSQAQLDTLSVLTGTLRATQDGLGVLNDNVRSQREVLAASAHVFTTHAASVANVVPAFQSLSEGVKTAVAGLETQQKTLTSVSTEAAGQAAALGHVTQELQGLTNAIGEVAAAVGQNSHGMLALSQRVADAHMAAEQTHTTTHHTAQRLDAAMHELPGLREAVHAVTEHLATLVHELRNYTLNRTTFPTNPSNEQVLGPLTPSPVGPVHHGNGTLHQAPTWSPEPATATYPPVDELPRA